jgi:hypothetical protein
MPRQTRCTYLTAMSRSRTVCSAVLRALMMFVAVFVFCKLDLISAILCAFIHIHTHRFHDGQTREIPETT